MTVKIKATGDVIDNETADMYDFFGLDSINPRFINDQLSEANGEDVEIEISSGGGDVIAASEIFTAISNYSGHTTAVVSGLAASAGSVIAMATDSLKMSPTAMLMIHRASTLVSGNANDAEHEAGKLRSVDDAISSTYAKKTGKSKNEILDLMDKETWMSADQAVSNGFADEVLEKQIQFVNASSGIIPKASVNKFKKMQQQSNHTKSQPSDNYKAKLAILLQEEGN